MEPWQYTFYNGLNGLRRNLNFTFSNFIIAFIYFFGLNFFGRLYFILKQAKLVEENANANLHLEPGQVNTAPQLIQFLGFLKNGAALVLFTFFLLGTLYLIIKLSQEFFLRTRSFKVMAFLGATPSQIALEYFWEIFFSFLISLLAAFLAIHALYNHLFHHASTQLHRYLIQPARFMIQTDTIVIVAFLGLMVFLFYYTFSKMKKIEISENDH